MSYTYTIYQIYCDTLPDFIYIGSTKAFNNRKYRHKYRCNTEYDKGYTYKIYKIIRENGGWDNWKMIPIELIKCDSKKEAIIREQYWIDLKKSNLNSVNACKLIN